jgi:hypothetical protein
METQHIHIFASCSCLEGAPPPDRSAMRRFLRVGALMFCRPTACIVHITSSVIHGVVAGGSMLWQE